MQDKLKKVTVYLSELLSVKNKMLKLVACCKEKQKVIDLLNEQIAEYNSKFTLNDVLTDRTK